MTSSWRRVWFGPLAVRGVNDLAELQKKVKPFSPKVKCTNFTKEQKPELRNMYLLNALLQIGIGTEKSQILFC